MLDAASAVMQETMLVRSCPSHGQERLACFASKECLGKREGKEVAAQKLTRTEEGREGKGREGKGKK
jgi:hypothetical protein